MMPAFRVEDRDVTGSGTRLHGVITQKERVWTASFANKQVMTSPSSVAFYHVSLIQSERQKLTKALLLRRYPKSSMVNLLHVSATVGRCQAAPSIKPDTYHSNTAAAWQ